MVKRITCLALIFTIVLAMSGCSNEALEEAQAAVATYNTQATEYNGQIAPYNEAIQKIREMNQELEDTVNTAQDALNRGETPFDEETITTLKSTMAEALNQKEVLPEELVPYDELIVDDKSNKTDLEALTAQANAGIEAMVAFKLPELPTIPDYSEAIQKVSDAQMAYEDSVQGLKQVTAPSDEFVMDRLRKVDTITAIEAVTEDHDPNGQLNKQGGYIGCIYFTDLQVNRDNLYIEAGQEGVIDVGCAGGGAIEIYKTVEDAQVRDTYLAGFDGTAFTSGSHYIIGTVLIRTSDELTGTKQLELTDKITQALISVEH